MSEFDAFESSAPAEEDPAAAFLANEQAQMAELEGDGFTVETTENTENTEAVLDAADNLVDAAPAVEQELQQAQSVSDEFDLTIAGVDNAGGAAEVADMFGNVPDTSLVRNDLVDQFGADPVDQFGANPAASDPYSDFSQPTDAYAAISSQDRIVQEPEQIRKWREEQKESLTAKDAEAEVKREEWREVAKRELEDWYRHREDQLEKSKKNNREAEAAFCQERDESVPGHEWERVTRLCEFNPKAARNSKDVSRMRSILLQLKQTPLVR